jgi:uncharacterized membrane protein
MKTNRLEAFSDGVIAIIITIMVLDLRVPHGTDLVAWKPLLPTFLSYALSFVYVGIYWNNHHHMFMATERVNGAILWANLHLLFWMSLIPFVSGGMGENNFSSRPVALYGTVLLLAGVAYVILQRAIIADQGKDSPLRAAVGRDYKGKVSLGVYILGIGLSFVLPQISLVLYLAIALMWLIPDRRIERMLAETHRSED